MCAPISVLVTRSGKPVITNVPGAVSNGRVTILSAIIADGVIIY